MTKGFIFDYGGTLDSGGCHWGKVLWHAYERCHVPVSEDSFRQAYVYGERTLGSNRIIEPDFTFRQTLEQKIRLQTEWLHNEGLLPQPDNYRNVILNDVYNKTVETTEKSVEVLKQIAQLYPMVLVSNFYGNVSTVLKEFGFAGLFKDVVESAVVGIRKPDKRIFQLGVQRLGMEPSEVTVVGDSHDKDIVPAHDAGCRTVWLKGEGWTDKEPEQVMADETVFSLNDVLLIAKRQR